MTHAIWTLAMRTNDIYARDASDSAFAERLFKTFDAMDRKQDEYKIEVERTGDKREIFEIARKHDTEMHGMIDEVFSVLSESRKPPIPV